MSRLLLLLLLLLLCWCRRDLCLLCRRLTALDGRKSCGQDSRLLLLEKEGVHRDNTSRRAVRLVAASVAGRRPGRHELGAVVVATGSTTRRTGKPRAAAAAFAGGGSSPFGFQQGHQTLSQVRAHVLIDPLHKGVAGGHGRGEVEEAGFPKMTRGVTKSMAYNNTRTK